MTGDRGRQRPTGAPARAGRPPSTHEDFRYLIDAAADTLAGYVAGRPRSASAAAAGALAAVVGLIDVRN